LTSLCQHHLQYRTKNDLSYFRQLCCRQRFLPQNPFFPLNFFWSQKCDKMEETCSNFFFWQIVFVRQLTLSVNKSLLRQEKLLFINSSTENKACYALPSVHLPCRNISYNHWDLKQKEMSIFWAGMKKLLNQFHIGPMLQPLILLQKSLLAIKLDALVRELSSRHKLYCRMRWGCITWPV
jgi:hypothetical protein